MTEPVRNTNVWPEHWKDLKICALDVETTGFDATTERVIEIGMVTFEAGEVTERWGSLVNPGKPIPQEVQVLTGITDEDVATAPTFGAVADQIVRRLDGVGICAYNLLFDRRFINAELERCGLEWPPVAPTLDPLIFAKELQKEHRKHPLGEVASRLGLTLENAHRATDDAEVAGRVLFAFEEKLPASLSDLLILQAQWEQIQARAEAVWKGRRSSDEPSAALQAVSMLGAKSIGLGPAYIYGEELDPLRAIYMSVPEVSR